MNIKAKNQSSLLGFCALLGGFAGLVIWVFLKVMSMGVDLLWEIGPEKLNLTIYPMIVCGIGGLLLGLFRRKYGDYPEEMMVVLGKIKRNKHYDYKPMFAIIISALIPLMIGASVGPEAGLVGIISGICYWVGDNVKAARNDAEDYSQIGVAVTLGILFHSPLFGIFHVEEDENQENLQIPKSSKLLLYGLSLAAAMAVYVLLNRIFGGGLGGFPSFDLEADLVAADYFMMIPYIAAGLVLAKIYEISHHCFETTMKKIPGGIREMLAGICLGAVGIILPVFMFSGEHELGTLPEEFIMYQPVMWMVIAIVKILMTNLCIQGGLKGGHFFPLIFAGACMGFGLAAMVFPAGGHQIFAAAIVTAALLGHNMKKPLAVTLLLMICFPVKIVVWILAASVIASKLFQKEHTSDK